MIDIESVRRQFQPLARIHNGFPVAYFDGPGGTQVPRVVADAVTDYLFHHNANTHWHYPTSSESDAIIWASREALADFFNSAPRRSCLRREYDDAAFPCSSRTRSPMGARVMRSSSLSSIITRTLRHGFDSADERGLTVKQVRMIPETGELDWHDLESKVGSKTRLLAIGAASNALGTKNDLNRAIALAHSVGALAFVDAVHFAAHAAIDVRALDCDFLACSAYKFYGPHIGVLYGRQELLSEVDVPKLRPSPDTAPERIETGTQNHEGIAGARAAVDFLASLAGETNGSSRRDQLEESLRGLHERGEALFATLWNGLTSTNGVRVFGPAPGSPRTPTVSFVVDGMPSELVATELAKLGIFVSHGNFYALTVAERLGYATDGLVRAGCACYSTLDEVERLISGVRRLVK
jgi:cysteine desulfurase family protein (TIGR01976 family)